MITALNITTFIATEFQPMLHSVDNVYPRKPLDVYQFVEFGDIRQLKEVIMHPSKIYKPSTVVFMPQSPILRDVNDCILNFLQRYDYTTCH
jgi:hypothetical protein